MPSFLLCFASLCFALLCFALLCFASLWFSLRCFALLCFALLCFALLCFAGLLAAACCRLHRPAAAVRPHPSTKARQTVASQQPAPLSHPSRGRWPFPSDIVPLSLSSLPFLRCRFAPLQGKDLETIDLKRTARSATAGLLVHGPLCHFWIELMQKYLVSAVA